METLSNPVLNRGARVLPLPVGVALEVVTADWLTITITLRRPTDRQRIAALGRMDRHGIGRSGPRVPYTCHPVVAVLRELDEYDLMPMSA